MAVIAEPRYPRPIHPLHAIFLAGALTLYLGALLSDIAYTASYEIQWNNFAAWLNAAGLVFGAVALVCALLGLTRTGRHGRRGGFYILLLIGTWVVGFVNALVHARDAWATMPGGLVLSAIVFVLACMAAWMGLRSPRLGETT